MRRIWIGSGTRLRAGIRSNSEADWDQGWGSDRIVRILNRIIQWEDCAITYEADQRHAELIVKYLGLNDKTNSVTTPGVKRTNGDDDDEEELS